MLGKVELQVWRGSRVLNRDIVDLLESREMAEIPEGYPDAIGQENQSSIVPHGLHKAQTMAMDPRVRHVQKTA